MGKCLLCDKTAQIQCYYCDDCGKVCRTNNCGDPPAWGNSGICKEHHRQQCEEIGAVMEYADDAFYAGEFNKVNEHLKELDVPNMSSQMCVTWLSVSKWAEKELPYRPEFFKKCYARLVETRGVEIANKLTKHRGVDQ